MTDEAYVFNQTNRERAIVKRSAAHKINGCKSKKCKLGVDRMSNKQIEKLHGPVESWNLTKFYSYDDFKRMPDDLKVEYLNRFIAEYRVGLSTIAMKMFGLSKTALAKYLHEHGLFEKIKLVEGTRTRNPVNRNKFIEAVEAARCSEESDSSWEPLSEDYEAPEDSSCPKLPVVQQTLSFSTSYISDHIDYDQLKTVEELFAGKKVTITISINSCDSDPLGAW